MPLATSLTPCPLYIAGEWLTPKIASTPVFNPSTSDIIAERQAGQRILNLRSPR